MAFRLIVLLFFLFFLAMSREPPWADAHVAFETTQALLERGQLDIHLEGPSYFFTYRNGKKYGFAALGNVIASIPSYLTYRTVHRHFHLADPPLLALTSHLSSALLMAWACGLFYKLCRRRGATSRLAVLLGLGLGLSTVCFCYARSPYSESLQTFALCLLVERTLSMGERMTYAGMGGLGVAAGILFNSKLVYAAILPLCGVYLLYEQLRGPKKIKGARLVLGLLVALGAFLPFVWLVMWHNRIKTGSLLQSGYRGDLFNGELLPGLYGYLFSTGQSIFLYSPLLILAVLGLRTGLSRLRAQTWLLLSIVALITLLNAKYYYWHGAFCWGPRLMAPITPLILLLAVPWLEDALCRGRVWLRRTGLTLLLAAGLCVQLIGASLYWDHYIRIVLSVRETLDGPIWSADHLPQAYFMPPFAPLRGHLWLLGHLYRHDQDLDHDAPWKPFYPQRIDLGQHWPRLRIDWWYLDWRTGPDRRAGLFLLSFFAMGAALSGLAVYRKLPQRTSSQVRS